MLTRATRRSINRSVLIYARSPTASLRSSTQCVSASLPPSARWFTTTDSSLDSLLDSRPRKYRSATSSTVQPSSSTTRSLSTVTDSLTYGPPDQIPLLSMANLASQDFMYPRQSSFAPILKAKTPLLGINRTETLGRDMNDLTQILKACLLVGRFDRAQSIVRKFQEDYGHMVAELQEVNNMLLRSMVQSLFGGASESISLRRLQLWFEADMKQLDIPPDSTTFALMIRTAFLLETPTARNITVRRYLSMADETNQLEDTLDSGEYTDQEWQTVRQTQLDWDDAELELEPPASEPLEAHQQPTVTRTADHLPSIRSSYSKGIGLETMRRNLQVLHEPQQDETRRELQLRIEENVVASELASWRTAHADQKNRRYTSSMQTPKFKAFLWEWYTDLCCALQQHIDDVKKAKTDTAYFQEDGPFLEAIGAQQLAAITIMVVAHRFTMDGPQNGSRLSQTVREVGHALEMESMSKHDKQERLGINSRNRLQKERNSRHRNMVETRDSIKTEPFADCASNLDATIRETESTRWPQQNRMRLALFLITKLIDNAKFQPRSTMVELEASPQHAFEHKLVWKKGRQMGILRLHEELAQLVTREPTPTFLAHQLPMVSTPEPWVDLRGAYLKYPADLVRICDESGNQMVYLKAALLEGNLEHVLGALNVLGQTEWQINKRLFEVMVEAWNTGDAFTNFPPADIQLTLPEKPGDGATGQEKLKWYREVQRLQDEHGGLHSNRCFMNLQLEIARSFSGRPFYIPHNLDFRGRAYPITPIFHHMNADNVRGLCQFAAGKELGATGLYWLKVQLSNTFGFDKASLDDRSLFVEKHMDEIRDSVADPLGGQRWWLKADDPWQCLAACYEVVGALDSPNPETYISHLPVQQDGTCNGLQHYAALGGDLEGAAQVNLLPSDKPGDIYSEVARLVIEQIEADEAKDHPMAKILKGKVTRKVVKQPVMTNVYGVTYYGASLQVKKRLEEILPKDPLATYDHTQLAKYLTSIIFEAFGSLFTGATRIQDWLSDTAIRVSTSISPEQVAELASSKSYLEYSNKGRTSAKARKTLIKYANPVIWTTPLNLPVVQPYRIVETKKLSSAVKYPLLQSLELWNGNSQSEVEKRRQVSGFPPNFVHSLDASHMMLTALKCGEEGMTFSSVHDSFWTHASDVPRMNSLLRDAFVEIHSENVMERLRTELTQRYKGHLQRIRLKNGHPLVKMIKAWRREKWGNQAMSDPRCEVKELVEEVERLRLLGSEDADEVAKGKAMVTPASLYEELGNGEINEVPSRGVQSDPLLYQSVESTAYSDTMPYDSSEAMTLDSHVDSSVESVEAEPISRKTAKPKSRKYALVGVWIPLVFKPLPPRGAFDVNVVKNSQYFFS